MGRPTRRDVLAGIGTPCFVSVTASGTVGATQSADRYATDFDVPASRLDEEGWTVEHGSFRTEDSSLVADGGAGNLDYQLSRPQTGAAGSFEVRGARNDHPFYGLRFQFVSDSPSFGEPPVAGGTQRGYQIVLRNTQNSGAVELERTDGDGGETLLTLADDHGGADTDVRVERDPDTWQFHCYLDGEHVGSVHDDTYTTSRYWVQKHGAGDSQRVDGLAMTPDATDGTPTSGTSTTAVGSTPVETISGPTGTSTDWLVGWHPLVAWLIGVPVLGPVVLAVLLVVTDRRGDAPAVEDDDSDRRGPG